MKDRRDVQDKAGGVYQLKCNDCSAVYVGKTGRQLKVRVNEHKEDARKKKPLSSVSASV